jgi:hypothetical protein
VRETGFSLQEIDQTVLVAAAPNETAGITLLRIAPEGAPTSKPGQFLITWPPGVPQAIIDEINFVFRRALDVALAQLSLALTLRAVLEVIAVAAQSSITVGPFVQFGFAIEVNGRTRYSYGEGSNPYLAGLELSQLENIVIDNLTVIPTREGF